MSNSKLAKKQKKNDKSRAEHVPPQDLSKAMADATLEEGEAGSSSGNPLPDPAGLNPGNPLSDPEGEEMADTTEDQPEEETQFQWNEEIAGRAFQLLQKEQNKLEDLRAQFAMDQTRANRETVIGSSASLGSEEMRALLEAIKKPVNSRLRPEIKVMGRMSPETINTLERDMNAMRANGDQIVIRHLMDKNLITQFTRTVTAETNGWAATEAEWLEWPPEILIARMRQSLNNGRG